LKFVAHTLTKKLSNHIESIFHYEGFQPDHSIERVVPTGHIFIIFELDGYVRHTFDNKTLERNGIYTQVWVSGNQSNYLSISAHENSEMLVIQLKPNGFLPVIHKPISELNGKVIKAEDLFGQRILEIRQELLNEAEVVDKFKIIEDWLLNRIDESKAPNAELDEVLEQLRNLSIENHNVIISNYPKTQKNLINQFKKYYGLTPKMFHRIFRFNEVLQELHKNKSISWTQIAYQFGYSDQSHFIKEFNEFSGFNPQKFIISDFHNEVPNFFPLDKKK